jgi:hypothetical protein
MRIGVWALALLLVVCGYGFAPWVLGLWLCTLWARVFPFSIFLLPCTLSVLPLPPPPG